jgi:hypothetical protein
VEVDASKLSADLGLKCHLSNCTNANVPPPPPHTHTFCWPQWILWSVPHCRLYASTHQICTSSHFFHTQIKYFHSILVCLPFVYLLSNLIITSWRDWIFCVLINKCCFNLWISYYGERWGINWYHRNSDIWRCCINGCLYNQVQTYLGEYATLKGPYTFVTSLQHLFMSKCQFLVISVLFYIRLICSYSGASFMCSMVMGSQKSC